MSKGDIKFIEKFIKLTFKDGIVIGFYTDKKLSIVDFGNITNSLNIIVPK